MPSNKRAELINLFHQLNVFQKGNFQLTSGEISNFYLDIKSALGNPSALILMSDFLFETFSEKISCVVAGGYGGIALATAVSVKYGLPLSMVRFEERKHGMKKTIEGYTPAKTDYCALIDDIFSTGKSICSLSDQIQSTEAEICGAHVVVNRTELSRCVREKISIPIYSLFTLKDFIC